MKLKTLNIIISSILCSLVAPALSQDSETLPVVTVTDNLSNSIDDTLENVDTINEANLSNPAITDIATALDDQLSVTFDYDGNGNALVPIIRGMGGNNTEVTIDGEKMGNYFEYGHGYRSGQKNSIEMDTIKKIDIVKGKHSPKQGNGALAGSINMRTYSPSDFVSQDDPYYVSFKTGYASKNKNFSNTLTGAYANGSLSGMVIYTHRQLDELSNQGSDEDETRHSKIESKQDNILLKGQADLELGNIIVTGEHFDAKTSTDRRYSERPGVEEPTTRDRFAIQGDFDNVLGLDAIEAKVSYQKLDRTSQMWSTWTNEHKNGVFRDKRYGVNIDALKTFDIGNINNELTFGLGFKRNEFDFKRVDLTSKKANRPMPLTTRDITHIYANNKITFDNGLTISPGVRVEHETHSWENDELYENNPASAVAKGPDSSNTSVTPSFAVAWANDKLRLHASYAKGKKSADDANFTSYDHGFAVILPNYELKDEESKNIEFGADYALNDRLSFGVNAFQSNYDNFIESVQEYSPSLGRPTIKPKNLYGVETQGVELRGKIAFTNQFDANLGVAWMKGDYVMDNGEKSPLLSAQPVTAAIGVNYHQGDVWGGSINTRVASKGASPETETEFRIPGYGMTNITAWAKPMKGMTISGGVYNIFDKTFWKSDINGQPTENYYGPVDMDSFTQPGRNFGASFKYEF